MRNLLKGFIIGIIAVLCLTGCRNDEVVETDVLIVGGGASGTMAGIQAARLGADCIIVEETPWLGGMLTSAGVSAVDGNYRLHSGLWEEFRQKIYDHYGGADSVRTGWVSNVLFEPHVGQQILTQMADEKNLRVMRNTELIGIEANTNGWNAVVTAGDKNVQIRAKVIIDATELGDIAKMTGVKYDIGMDSRLESGEEIAPLESNNIIQDLTYVAVLKDYGDNSHVIKEAPNGYDPSKFHCTCAGKCDEDSLGKKLWECGHMMEYGHLPNGYYMINWPIFGNDYYLNIIEMSKEEREVALQKAKNFTLGYVYYLQHELGFTNLGIADDIFDTEDNLPYIPYHRESRRIKGLVRYTVNDMARPFEQENPLYRTGIAVGDYPVDHHHQAYPEAHKLPELHFYPVPSYNLPLGTLMPKHKKNLIVAEKSISVSNIVNGTTRLQPVCMLVGQASGVLAALAVKNDVSPDEIPVRDVQKSLLEHGAYIMPYSDILPDDKAFYAMQRIGATGILKGEGKNIGWENHTHIYPDSLVSTTDLVINLDGWLPADSLSFRGELLGMDDFISLVQTFHKVYDLEGLQGEYEIIADEARRIMKDTSMGEYAEDEYLTRSSFAVLLDRMVNPFELKRVDHNGHFIK